MNRKEGREVKENQRVERAAHKEEVDDGPPRLAIELSDSDIDDLFDEWENARIYEQEIAIAQFEKGE